MSYTELFYWLTVAENMKDFFVFFIIIFGASSIASTIAFFVGRDSDGECPEDGVAERAKKWIWWSVPFLMVFWFLNIATPDKKQALLIIAGGTSLDYLANDSVAKQIPREMSTFVISELKNMAKEAKVDLGIATQKDKILETAKEMSAEQLIQAMKDNPDMKKILLE
jgi:hypothetical protein